MYPIEFYQRHATQKGNFGLNDCTFQKAFHYVVCYMVGLEVKEHDIKYR